MISPDAQLDIFAPVTPQVMPEPRSRRTDPSTSHAAASRYSEALKGQAREVLELIQVHQGYTACELAKVIAKTEADQIRWRYRISRRCADLFLDGLLRHGAKRRCKVTGTVQITWYSV